MNVLSLEFADSHFDAIIDKGTLDSILVRIHSLPSINSFKCGENSYTNGENMQLELCRVLKPGGVLITISYATPEHRLGYFNKPKLAWKAQHTTLEKPRVQGLSPDDYHYGYHYAYICTKEQ